MEWNEETMLLVCEEILPRSSRQSDSLILQLHRHMIYPHSSGSTFRRHAVDCEARTLLAPISTSKPQKIVGTVGMTQNYVSEQEGESDSFCWCTTPCGCLLFTVCFPGCCVLRANFVVSIQLHTSPKSLILLCSGRGFRECMLWSYNSYILESQSLQQ